jgi:hypothetical protein
MIITGLAQSFFQPQVMSVLRDKIASCGEIHTWATLKSFGRVIAVFYTEDEAENVREACDGLQIPHPSAQEPTIIRVYRGTPTVLNPAPELITLQVPHQEKNFLISPPGSPPVGWEPATEEPPNTDTLASDLITALQKLQFSHSRRLDSQGREILMAPEEGEEGLAVFVEDCDSNGEPKTPEEVEEPLMMGAPPRIGMVRATVTSMGIPPSAFTPPGFGTSFVPTARPPAA